MMRILGKQGMASAYKGDNGGFAGPDVAKAWKKYKELCDMDPFQEGFQTTKPHEAAGLSTTARPRSISRLACGF